MNVVPQIAQTASFHNVTQSQMISIPINAQPQSTSSAMCSPASSMITTTQQIPSSSQQVNAPSIQQPSSNSSPVVDAFESSLSPLGKKINGVRKGIENVFKITYSAHIFSQNCVDTICRYFQYCMVLLPNDENKAFLYLETISDYIERLITAYIAQVDKQLNKESTMETPNANTVKVLSELRQWCLRMLVEEKNLGKQLENIRKSLVITDAETPVEKETLPEEKETPVRQETNTTAKEADKVVKNPAKKEKRQTRSVLQVLPISYSPRSSIVVPPQCSFHLPEHLELLSGSPRETLPLMSTVFEIKDKEMIPEKSVVRGLKRSIWEMNGEMATIRQSMKECMDEMKESISKCTIDCEGRRQR